MPPSLNETFNLCLPLDPPKNQMGIAIEPNALMLSSPNINLRVVGEFMDFENQPPGMVGHPCGFLISHGIPFVIVAHVKERYALKNDYHRALALRQAGVTHMPAVVVEASDFSHVIPATGFFNPHILSLPNPPVVGHFANGRAVTVSYPSFMKVVRIQVSELSIRLDPPETPLHTFPILSEIAATASSSASQKVSVK